MVFLYRVSSVEDREGNFGLAALVTPCVARLWLGPVCLVVSVGRTATTALVEREVVTVNDADVLVGVCVVALQVAALQRLLILFER